MNSNKVNQTYDIQLTTLTPISIGTSDVLSPYTDFVFDEQRKQIHIIDKSFIAARILEKQADTKLMDEYVNFIRGTFDNNRSSFDLKQFLERKDKLNLAPRDYAQQIIPYNGLDPKDRREVKCTLKNANQPYISGSTLKGAIKAALLYDWLNNEAKEELDKLMQAMLQTYKKCERDINELNRLAAKRFPTGEDRIEMRKKKEAIKRGGAQVMAKDFDRLFDKLLTYEYDFAPRDFSLLKVGDTQPCPTNSLIFQLTQRLHYNKGEVSIPANLEAIKANTKTKFRLAIESKFQHPDLKFLNEEKSIIELFRRINQFHKNNIDMETELLDNGVWYEKARAREKAAIDQYQQSLEKLYKELDNALPHETYLCIGFGKSFFYNSIGMLIYDWKGAGSDDKLTPFQKYCKLSFLGRDGQRDFPLTKTLTSSSEPMGWVKLVVNLTNA
jgi:CRISPR-associated protein Csm5